MTTTRFEAMELPIKRVVPSPINVRTAVGDISELANSIREQGILEPLVVRPTTNGNYEVIIGSRRLASAKEIGLPVVPVIVQHISDADAIVRSLVENLQRGDLSLEDRVEAYKRLQEIDVNRFGTTQALAKALGRKRIGINNDFEAYEAKVRLRPRGIQVVHNAPPTSGERRNREAIPETHASLLERAMSGVRGRLPEEEIEDTYTELAQAIAPLEQGQARRLLDGFKMYPEKSVADIESMVFATVERTVTLPAETARHLEQMSRNEGTSNWGDAITRLVELTPEPNQESTSEAVPSETLLQPLRDNAKMDEPEEQQILLHPQSHRPPRLPESPEPVQRHNKEIWNIEHLPIEADFYTIGYAGRDIEQFLALLQAVNVSTLVDIRYTPVSQYKPAFSKENLKKRLSLNGIRYIHKSVWGVPQEIRSRSIGQDTRDAIWDWYDSNVVPKMNNGEFAKLRESVKSPIALMCVETAPTDCHRHRLFLSLEQTGLKGFDL